MGLHLGAEFPLDNDVGLREALRDVAADGARRSPHVAVQRSQPGDHAAGKPEPVAGRLHRRRVGLPALFHVHDKRQRLVVDPNEAQRFTGGRRRNGGDSGDGRAHVSARVFRGPDSRPDRVRSRARHLDDQRGAHARKASRRPRIDRDEPCVRQRRAQKPAREHARQNYVHRVARRAGDLGAAVLPRRRTCRSRERGVRRQRRRLVEGNLPLHLAEADAGDAERKFLGPRLAVRAMVSLCALAAASVAATTCGYVPQRQ